MKIINPFAELIEGLKAEDEAENEIQELLNFHELQLAKAKQRESEAKQRENQATQKAKSLQIEFARHLLKLNTLVAEIATMTGLDETTILKLT
jgi:predicted transposase YdaD